MAARTGVEPNFDPFSMRELFNRAIILPGDFVREIRVQAKMDCEVSTEPSEHLSYEPNALPGLNGLDGRQNRAAASAETLRTAAAGLL